MKKNLFIIIILMIVTIIFGAIISCQQNKQKKVEEEKQKIFQLIQKQSKTENKAKNSINKNFEKGEIHPQRGSMGVGNYDFGTVPGFKPTVNSATGLTKQKKKKKKIFENR